MRIVSLFCCWLLIAGCGPDVGDHQSGPSRGQVKWNLVTTWPKNFPGLGEAPERFAQQVAEMSGGRLQVKVYGANQLIPAGEVFDAVSAGIVQMGHSGAYYWKGKVPAAQFFTSVPFGMTAQQMNAYLHYGGGMALWQELYAPFDLVPLAGGNTGVQMAGWFRHEINSVEDLKGLRMRIPGLGGEVLAKLGGVPVSIPGSELFTALQTGTIDAAEWVGPYNDKAFGLNQIAGYYYYPGWHEPGPSMEFIVNAKALAALPSDLQAIVRSAARAVNADLLDEYTARSAEALAQLLADGVKLRPLPPSVLAALRQANDEVMAEQAAKDPQFARVLAHYRHFLADVRSYDAISEYAYQRLVQEDGAGEPPTPSE